MEKSLELFAKQGFHATSVQQITEHCGISKGAFYLSFKSKDELIFTLIDHFMKTLVSDIDQVVRGSKKEDLLYKFYYVNFHFLNEKSNFAKLFIKEQAHFVNDEFIEKIYYYIALMQKSILTMIEKLYGEKIKDTKYDLLYLIQGLMKTYLELFFFYHLPMDLDRLCQSLVEKTDLLANYVTMPYITVDSVQLIQKPQKEALSTDELIHILEQNIEDMDASIEKESLELLKEEVIHPSMGQAIILGLLENIKHHPNCKWVSYVLRKHFQDRWNSGEDTFTSKR